MGKSFIKLFVVVALFLKKPSFSEKLGFSLSQFVVATFAVLLTCSVSGAAERTYVDLGAPSLQKIPIAIPLFPTTPDSAKLSGKLSDFCSDSLDFTGYFRIIDRGAFLEDYREMDNTGGRTNFRNWTVVGAELLITGGVRSGNDQIEMELRLFDTLKGSLLVGKKYTGRLTDHPRMIHRFCSEVIYHLTGTRGVFDSKIAFISNGSGNKEVYLCDFDGQHPKRFTRNHAITLFPAWSSDGKWLAYTSYKRGRPHIYIEHRREKHGFVIDKKGINITPAWLPGQFKLAATLSHEGNQNIYLLTGKGRQIKKLTTSWGIDTSPTWSPDGRRMAFVSNRAGTPQIYVKRIDSGRVERLTFQGKYNTQPNWSPKGNKIAYSARMNGRHQICTIGFDGKGPVQLTSRSGDNESPSWSPDGSMIVFGSTRGGPSRMYVMTAYGTDQRRLLALPGEQTNPAWSPAGVDN